MESQFSRTALLLGDEAIDKLRKCRVAVFGVGGVGGAAVEALERSGIGTLDLCDNDTVAASNLNRQLIATADSVGRPKAEVQAERIRSINPDCRVTAINMFYSAENADGFDLSAFDYVVDAIDTVTSKLILAVRCRDAGVRLISSMGTGNKLDPSRFRVSDISKTSVCPLARVMRRELKARGIYHLKVVYSDEEVREGCGDNGHGKRTPASISFVPGAAGLVIAGEVIREIAGI